MPYEFTDALKTGHSTIDGEHQIIIESVNETLKEIERGASPEEILEAIKIFTRYVKKHFPNEEKLQERFHYPNIQFHKLWHRNYVKDIEKTSDKILVEGISPLTIAELKRRVEMLIQHILLEDSKVATHIQKQNKSVI